MATYETGEHVYAATTPRKVGGATVWDVTATGPEYVPRKVGKVVLRDGYLFVRDVSSCGEPLKVSTGIARLTDALWLFARYLAA